MKYTGLPGGKWKPTQNEITEITANGQKRVRFLPVEPFQVSEFMIHLHQLFNDELRNQHIDPLILIPLYTIDLLCIHPFLDGNGRVSRLASILLLYQHGYEVARYISLERIIENTKESYYETLESSSTGWHEGKHNPLPWITYFLSTVLAAYDEFERRAGVIISGRGSKTKMVFSAIENMMGDFTMADLEKACPLVGKDMIRHVLNQLHKDGKAVNISRGRYARWRKV
jgi:Fic family protein